MPLDLYTVTLSGPDLSSSKWVVKLRQQLIWLYTSNIDQLGKLNGQYHLIGRTGHTSNNNFSVLNFTVVVCTVNLAKLQCFPQIPFPIWLWVITGHEKLGNIWKADRYALDLSQVLLHLTLWLESKYSHRLELVQRPRAPWMKGRLRPWGKTMLYTPKCIL